MVKRPAVMLRLFCCACLLVLISPASGAEMEKYWFYVSTNLMVGKNVDDLTALINRAAKAGYNGMVLTDVKFSRLAKMPDRYFKNIEKIKQAAAAAKIEIVPCLFPVGYSEGLLANDPNLAEGLPVRDALFVVKGGVAGLVAEPGIELKSPDFRDWNGWSFRDPVMVAENGVVTAKNPGEDGHARMCQKVRVHPFRQYHVSVEIRTEGYTPETRIAVLAGKDNRDLCYSKLGVKPSQDWTTHEVVFNSLDNDEVLLYFGSWESGEGTVQWRNPKLEEVGLLNVLRRPGAPLKVMIEGGRELKEGVDFEPVGDPALGNRPYEGCYEVFHAPPLLRANLPDGTRLRISYFHPVIINDGQVVICLSDPGTAVRLREEAVRIHAAWGAKGYFMGHDEIRVMNWDACCQNSGKSAGALLADQVRSCISILKEVNPGGDIYVWSDMFDPAHNAKDKYYLVNGSLAGSWEGLSKDVIVVPWAIGTRDKTLPFFAGRGHRELIAGYYDSDPEEVREWLKSAQGVPNAIGVMYTTWEKNYGDLERFIGIVKEAEGKGR